MNWTIEVKPNALKQYAKLDTPTKKRIKNALIELENSDNPFTHTNVKNLSGELKGDYRLRVGDWRLLFTPDKLSQMLYIYAILPRGNAYK